MGGGDRIFLGWGLPAWKQKRRSWYESWTCNSYPFIGIGTIFPYIIRDSQLAYSNWIRSSCNCAACHIIYLHENPLRTSWDVSV